MLEKKYGDLKEKCRSNQKFYIGSNRTVDSLRRNV